MSWLLRMEIGAESAFSRGILDTYAWHQRLWECFPDEPKTNRDFLTRIDPLEGAFRLWVLSKRFPVCPEWCSPENFAVKEIAPSFLLHRYYAFDLRANPVKTIPKRGANGEILLLANGKRNHGKRIPLVKHDELRAWLIRKGNVRCQNIETGKDIPGGFKIIEDRPLEIRPMVEYHFQRKRENAYHGGVQFRGTLEVTDIAHFTESYYNGIGSAKGFGFGLLLLSPITM